jgi:hypothetical protein
MTDIPEMERNKDVLGLIAALKDKDGIVRPARLKYWGEWVTHRQ